MPDPLKRRDFIKTASIFGASIVVSDPLLSNDFLPGDGVDAISNKYFAIFFDRKKGVFHIRRNNGTTLISGATSCVNVADGKRLITCSKFKFTTRSSIFSDQIGTGIKLAVIATDNEKKLDLEIQLSLYDQLEAISVETICKNISKNEIVIHSIEPIRAIKKEDGLLHIDGVSKCITNGEMYFDAGMIHEFDANSKSNTPGKIKGVTLANNSLSDQSDTIHSWWNAGFFSGYDKEGLVLGYLENNSCLGNLLISKNAANEISFLAESVYAPGLILKPGKSISSNRVMVLTAPNPYAALEYYADAIGKINKSRPPSIINGWCSWFYTLAQVSEAEVVSNTEFAAKHLKQYGLDYIQIDEGYQKWHGDWEGNSRFLHGMKWLANKIKSYGFKAGIWISPYVISEPTELFQKHPDWLLKGADGNPQRVGTWSEDSTPPADENPKRYCLDITHPEAAKWLHDLIHTIANDWGYDMIKIDFVAWSILAATRYHDPTMSSAQVYRKGMEIMRNAAGDKCHILECGPGAITVGLIDSMRIEADVNYGFEKAAWETYFLHPACSASAAAKRYYFHKRTWVNDADHICMHLLNNQESEAAATIIGMSGGNMMSGDRLLELDPYKLEILKKISPSFGEAAFPVDLFDTDMESVFALKIKKTFAEWTVIAFFNASLTDTIEKKFSLGRFGLDPSKTYLAFDFWKHRLFGEINNEIKVSVQPGSVTLLSLHEKKGVPQFLSTDRHIMQGAIEMENLKWNENTKTISGTSVGPLNSSHNVSVFIPAEHLWNWGSNDVLFRDYDSYSLKLVDSHIIQVHVSFQKADKVTWQIKMDEFFK